MNSQRTFIDDLKHQYKYGGATIRLIFINAGIFLLINLIFVFGRLGNAQFSAEGFVYDVFALQTPFSEFIYKPWGIITSIFSHFSFFHFLFNMIFLFFTGRIFESMFDQKRLYWTYALGGIIGGLFELIAASLFPGLEGANTIVVGASGSIMAIFFAIAFFKPNLKVSVFFFEVRVIILAAIFFLMDFLNLGTNDSTAHFAHIGGAILGIWSIHNIYNSGNIINFMQSLGDRILRFFSVKKRSNLKVKKGGNTRNETDEEYNARKNQNQQEIDRILDKISKSGYDSLTKKEKDFLFNQSNK